MGSAARRVRIPPVGLEGDLVVPREARGVVVFAHGSGSSRHSSRNRYVAAALQESGLATLLFDLLTLDEEAQDRRTADLRFDLRLLGQRLLDATEWLAGDSEAAALRVGYFGASTGAGAALVAAVQKPESVCAVVSRGGRPDLAGDDLPRVQAPVLLIVGSEDGVVVDLNERAYAAMRAPKQIDIIPGAGHLFEEPGALERVAELARGWFVRYLQ